MALAWSLTLMETDLDLDLAPYPVDGRISSREWVPPACRE